MDLKCVCLFVFVFPFSVLIDFRRILLCVLLVWTIECRSFFKIISKLNFLRSLTLVDHEVTFSTFSLICDFFYDRKSSSAILNRDESRRLTCDVFRVMIYVSTYVSNDINIVLHSLFFIRRIADHQFTCVIKQVRRWMFSHEKDERMWHSNMISRIYLFWRRTCYRNDEILHVCRAISKLENELHVCIFENQYLDSWKS